MRPRKLLWTLLILAGLSAAACSAVQPPIYCDSDDDCFNDEAAAGIQYVCDRNDTRVCLRQCSADTDCLALQYCDVPASADTGVCRDSEGAPPPGDDDPAGDEPPPGDDDPAGDEPPPGD